LEYRSSDGRKWSGGDVYLQSLSLCKIDTRTIVKDVKLLQNLGVNAVTVMSNDTADYAEDTFDNMHKVSEKFGFTFPYLLDATQNVAKAYGAVCAPDFFCINNQDEIKYRGRMNSAGISEAHDGFRKDLVVVINPAVKYRVLRIS